jgi:pyruvate dehydrogenase (quinone)/pyruvate oxidase
MLMAEFATAVKYGLPIRVVLIRDRVENGVAVDFAEFAKACGGTGFAVPSAAECGATLAQAFKEAGPVLVAA